jgi:hypothetical protein
MFDQLRRRLTYANVTATLALFLVLGGGTALGAYVVSSNRDIGPDTVSGHQPPTGDHANVIGGSINAVDIANDAVTAPKLGCQGNDAGDVMVKSGSVCIDRYEDSIWTSRRGGTRITGAIPCAPNGQNCKGKIFARSVRGVSPRVNITWFQAQQALANSGKRLPTNSEWQQAVAGTPDGAPCKVSFGLQNTGASPGCISDWGANDMVGNAWEWVADWVPASTACPGWGAFSDDQMCLSGASATAKSPHALVRGGGFGGNSLDGPFAEVSVRPQSTSIDTGFRGAR